MRFFVVLGSVLFISVIGARAAPTDDCESPPPAVADCVPGAIPPAVIRTETRADLSRSSSTNNTETQTKDKVKVKVKKDKHGNTITTIKEVDKTKTKINQVSDDFKQSNHTLTEGGIEDSESLTQEKQHQLKEVDIKKKTDTERIVTDKYGNVISDTHKTKEKEKTKKKETDSETTNYVHTIKQAPPPSVPMDAPEVPVC